MTQKERMMAGLIYDPGDEEILREQYPYLGRLKEFNDLPVDDGEVYIGDAVMFGPNVTIATAGHPVLPQLRKDGIQYNKEVHIQRNVWIGANVVILPGVTIGENSVIGAGSVVTKDIPANVVAVGSPCRVLRPIGEKDRKTFFRDEEFDEEARELWEF